MIRTKGYDVIFYCRIDPDVTLCGCGLHYHMFSSGMFSSV